MAKLVRIDPQPYPIGLQVVGVKLWSMNLDWIGSKRLKGIRF
jgi:hypothetical protein